MSILSAADIAAVQDLKRETLPAPEWGGELLLQELTGRQREQLLAWLRNLPDDDPSAVTHGYRERVLAMSLISEDGTPLFPDLEEGVAVLGAKSNPMLVRAADAALTLSSLIVSVPEVAQQLPNGESPSAGSTSPRDSARRSRSSKQR